MSARTQVLVRQQQTSEFSSCQASSTTVLPPIVSQTIDATQTFLPTTARIQTKTPEKSNKKARVLSSNCVVGQKFQKTPPVDEDEYDDDQFSYVEDSHIDRQSSPQTAIQLNIDNSADKERSKIQQTPFKMYNQIKPVEKVQSTPVKERNKQSNQTVAAVGKNQTSKAQFKSVTRPTLNSQFQQMIGTQNNQSSKAKNVDILIIGGGPASLGFLINAVKQKKYGELVQGDSIAIVEQGLSFGGGDLGYYGINSNTSAAGFLKCLIRRPAKVDKDSQNANSSTLPKKITNQLANTSNQEKQQNYRKLSIKSNNTNVEQNSNDQLSASKPTSQHCTNPNEPETVQELPNEGTEETPQTSPIRKIGQLRAELQESTIKKISQQTQSASKSVKKESKSFKDQTRPNLRSSSKKPTFSQLYSATVKDDKLSQMAQQLLETPEILTPMKELYNSNIACVMKKFAKSIVPLSMVGHLLNYAGNHLLYYTYQQTSKKIFYPRHRAVSIQLMQNGDIVTKVEKTEFYVVQKDQNSETQDKQYEVIESNTSFVYFRSKAVLVTTGAKQNMHPELFNWFPNLDSSKVLSSDSFLKQQVFTSTIKKLQQTKPKNIVIVGGSHSGFSCAWLLLNGPAMYYHNKTDVKPSKVPNANRKQPKNCTECCRCKNKDSLRKQDKDRSASMNNLNRPNNLLNNLKQNQEEDDNGLFSCNCVCKCFGFFKYQDWQFDYSKGTVDFNQCSIKIIYRDKIKIFYKHISEAVQDNYTQYDPDKFKKDGMIYSFTGLRGDAKQLYTDIAKGRENRVKLIKAPTIREQRPYIEGADLVIWACGYQTKPLPIYDSGSKRPLALSQMVPNTQYDVDIKNRIMLADGKSYLSKCFAAGVGYPVRTKDGAVITSKENNTKNNPRADGFSLYMNAIGERLVNNMLPKQNKLYNINTHKQLNKDAIQNSYSKDNFSNFISQNNTMKNSNQNFYQDYQQVNRYQEVGCFGRKSEIPPNTVKAKKSKVLKPQQQHSQPVQQQQQTVKAEKRKVSRQLTERSLPAAISRTQWQSKNYNFNGQTSTSTDPTLKNKVALNVGSVYTTQDPSFANTRATSQQKQLQTSQLLLQQSSQTVNHSKKQSISKIDDQSVSINDQKSQQQKQLNKPGDQDMSKASKSNPFNLAQKHTVAIVCSDHMKTLQPSQVAVPPHTSDSALASYQGKFEDDDDNLERDSNQELTYQQSYNDDITQLHIDDRDYRSQVVEDESKCLTKQLDESQVVITSNTYNNKFNQENSQVQKISDYNSAVSSKGQQSQIEDRRQSNKMVPTTRDQYCNQFNRLNKSPSTNLTTTKPLQQIHKHTASGQSNNPIRKSFQNKLSAHQLMPVLQNQQPQQTQINNGLAQPYQNKQGSNTFTLTSSNSYGQSNQQNSYQSRINQAIANNKQLNKSPYINQQQVVINNTEKRKKKTQRQKKTAQASYDFKNNQHHVMSSSNISNKAHAMNPVSNHNKKASTKFINQELNNIDKEATAFFVLPDQNEQMVQNATMKSNGKNAFKASAQSVNSPKGVMSQRDKMQKALKQTYIDDNQMLIENEAKSEYLPPIILKNTSNQNHTSAHSQKNNSAQVMLNEFMQKRVSKQLQSQLDNKSKLSDIIVDAPSHSNFDNELNDVKQVSKRPSRNQIPSSTRQVRKQQKQSQNKQCIDDTDKLEKIKNNLTTASCNLSAFSRDKYILNNQVKKLDLAKVSQNDNMEQNIDHSVRNATVQAKSMQQNKIQKSKSRDNVKITRIGEDDSSSHQTQIINNNDKESRYSDDEFENSVIEINDSEKNFNDNETITELKDIKVQTKTIRDQRQIKLQEEQRTKTQTSSPNGYVLVKKTLEAKTALQTPTKSRQRAIHQNKTDVIKSFHTASKPAAIKVESKSSIVQTPDFKKERKFTVAKNDLTTSRDSTLLKQNQKQQQFSPILTHAKQNRLTTKASYKQFKAACVRQSLVVHHANNPASNKDQSKTKLENSSNLQTLKGLLSQQKQHHMNHPKNKDLVQMIDSQTPTKLPAEKTYNNHASASKTRAVQSSKQFSNFLTASSNKKQVKI